MVNYSRFVRTALIGWRWSRASMMQSQTTPKSAISQ